MFKTTTHRKRLFQRTEKITISHPPYIESFVEDFDLGLYPDLIDA
jgi:hypothetical protein